MKFTVRYIPGIPDGATIEWRHRDGNITASRTEVFIFGIWPALKTREDFNVFSSTLRKAETTYLRLSRVAYTKAEHDIALAIVAESADETEGQRP